MTDRRGNGLLADAYVPLILLTPVLADTMLEALGRVGIAAYAVPLNEDVLEPDESVDDEATPTDHLYVDAKERQAAEGVLRAELPELADRSVDETAPPDLDGSVPSRSARDRAEESAVWADLVARFYEHDDPGTSRHAWPDAENVPDPASGDLLDTPGSEPETETDGSLVPGLQHVQPPSPDDERPSDLDDGEHFIPPPPPPLPRGDLTSRAAWAGLLGGPTLLLVSTILGVRVPGWLVLAILCAFVAGFVVLLIRMGDHPPHDSGPDDGAVI